MKTFWLDFETFSEVDVKKTGAYAYAAHPSTEVLCMAYAFDSDPVQLWLPGDEFPDIAGCMLCAHNIEFERELLWHIFGIDTSIDQWEDTAAIARFQSLPGGLDDLCAFFGYHKHPEGHKAMLKLCKPRKPSKKNPATRWTPESAPSDFAALYDYCKWDVTIMRRNYEKLRPMHPEERKIWAMTIAMNERGLPIDVKFLNPIKRVLSVAKEEAQAQVMEITGGIKTSQNMKLAEWLGVQNLQRPNVEKWLREWPESPKKTVLQTRYDIEKSSLKKLEAIGRMLTPPAQGWFPCIRGSLVYAGADRTRRWSGSGIQPQNLPRGYSGEKLDKVFEELMKPYPEFENPHLDISQSLKGLIVPPGDAPWVAADYSQIEVRALAWESGSQRLLNIFREGGDPYKDLASIIYNMDVNDIAKDSIERFLCKQLVLGCGYGLGHAKFHNMLTTKYNTSIELEECKRLVKLYRSANKGIVRFWYAVEDAFKEAICGFENRVGAFLFRPDHPPYLKHGIEGNSVAIELPSGGVLYYNKAQIDNDGRARYFGRNQYTHKLELVTTYGGKITENITQALSRDIMAQKMLELEAARYPLHLTVHDEVMAQLIGKKERFIDILTSPLEWAPDLPLEVECKVIRRYQK